MRHIHRNDGLRVVAVADVDPLPGCSQVGVIHNSFVDPSERSMGYGGEAHAMRLHDMKHEMLMDCALCTVDMTNTPQLKIMDRFGWTKAKEFKSRKTGHTVGLFVKVL